MIENETDVFKVLFVCTGNICRSPMAEKIAPARLRNLPLVFSSAGSAALIEMPMTDQARDTANQFGGVNSFHSAKQLTRDLIAESDVVLGLSREHRGEIAKLLPRSTRYSFTLRQFATLLRATSHELSSESGFQPSKLSVGALRELIPELAGRRGFVPLKSDASLDDIEDPYRHNQAIYDRVGQQINDALTQINGGIRLLMAD